ncbi:MAG: hypothetical protein O2921_00140 [Chloroflexi bacterium]|nr:hypothetical protein [Chloroflexota bacterium]MDA1281030.1 hypothetical protein [Chloroflexota bacterium]
MANKRPSFKDMDRDGDGITGHEKGLSNQDPSWVSENTGKLVLAGAIVVIVILIFTVIQDANAAKEPIGN